MIANDGTSQQTMGHPSSWESHSTSTKWGRGSVTTTTKQPHTILAPDFRPENYPHIITRWNRAYFVRYSPKQPHRLPCLWDHWQFSALLGRQPPPGETQQLSAELPLSTCGEIRRGGNAEHSSPDTFCVQTLGLAANNSEGTTERVKVKLETPFR